MPIIILTQLVSKLGFTTQAKNCLVAASNKNDLELISIVLHAESTDDGRSARYLDTINLLEYGNNNYKAFPILKKGEIVKTINIPNASNDTKTVNVVAKDTISITLPNSEEANISASELLINDNLSAPISAGTVLGNANYTVNGISYTTELIAETDVNIVSENTSQNSQKLKFINLLYIFLVLVIIRFILFILKKHTTFFHVSKKSKKGKRYLNS